MKRFRAYWVAALAILVGVGLVAVGLFWKAAPQEVADPGMTEAPTPVASAPTVPPTEKVSLKSCDVDGMYIPGLPLKKGERRKWDIITLNPQQDAIGDIPLPPRDSSLSDPNPPAALVSGYTLKYHLAGSNPDDMVVVVGHSSPWRVLPFNSLMNQGKEGEEAPRVKVGQRIYLHTTCSGEWWLDYGVDETLTAGKPAFTSDPRIFGTTKMPGRVAVITCLQPKEGPSHEVVAIIGQYQGLVKFP